MSEEIREFLDRDVDEVKESLHELDHELEQVIEIEREEQEREELIEWLEGKKERLKLINDEERLKELLSHLEYAYRTAAVSEETYQNARDLNRKLLREN
jgi:hypothetical protein